MLIDKLDIEKLKEEVSKVDQKILTELTPYLENMITSFNNLDNILNEETTTIDKKTEAYNILNQRIKEMTDIIKTNITQKKAIK